MSATRIDRWTRLYQIAESQSGVFSRSQYVEAGFPASTLDTNIDKHLFIALTNSIFRLQLFPDSMREQEDLYVLQLSVPSIVFSGATALWLHDLRRKPSIIYYYYGDAPNYHKMVSDIAYINRNSGHNHMTKVELKAIKLGGLSVFTVDDALQDLIESKQYTLRTRIDVLRELINKRTGK